MELVRSTLALALLASCAGQQCGAGQQAPVCDATESCCMDYKGCTGYCSECCNAMVTKCVEPRGTFITSTCCPRWTVGCTHGSVGCCDPASPWQAKPGEALELPAQPAQRRLDLAGVRGWTRCSKEASRQKCRTRTSVRPKGSSTILKASQAVLHNP